MVNPLYPFKADNKRIPCFRLHIENAYEKLAKKVPKFLGPQKYKIYHILCIEKYRTMFRLQGCKNQVTISVKNSIRSELFAMPSTHQSSLPISRFSGRNNEMGYTPPPIYDTDY